MFVERLLISSHFFYGTSPESRFAGRCRHKSHSGRMANTQDSQTQRNSDKIPPAPQICRRLSGIKSPLPHFRFLVRGHRSEYRTGFLIKGPTVMPVPADSAVSYWLAIVHSVLDRLDRAQIRKDALQIFVGHVTEIPPWHDGIEFARAHFARAHDFQEHRFVVITDAGRI